MKNIFHKDSLIFLESFTFTKTLIAFDFDGTLAPIVKNPSQAFMNSKTKKLIIELSKYAPVAIISGRSLEDLNHRVDIKVKYLVGNHGLESIISKKGSLNLAEKICINWRKNLMRKFNNIQNNITIENKRFSLAIHYRKSRNKKEAKHIIFESIEQLKPSPRIIMGKSVFNLVPVGGPHKGIALLEFLALSKSNRAIFIGDDETDEDVFSLADKRILSVRVGRKKESNAQFYINNQSEINKFIKKLIIFYKNEE